MRRYDYVFMATKCSIVFGGLLLCRNMPMIRNKFGLAHRLLTFHKVALNFVKIIFYETDENYQIKNIFA